VHERRACQHNRNNNESKNDLAHVDVSSFFFCGFDQLLVSFRMRFSMFRSATGAAAAPPPPPPSWFNECLYTHKAKKDHDFEGVSIFRPCHTCSEQEIGVAFVFEEKSTLLGVTDPRLGLCSSQKKQCSGSIFSHHDPYNMTYSLFFLSHFYLRMRSLATAVSPHYSPCVYGSLCSNQPQTSAC